MKSSSLTVPDPSVCIRSCEHWEDYRLSDVLSANRLEFVNCIGRYKNRSELRIISRIVGGRYDDFVNLIFLPVEKNGAFHIPFPDRIVLRYDKEKQDFYWLNEDNLS